MSETITDYMFWTRSTAQYPDACTGADMELIYLALGIAGESGEAVDVVKKFLRCGTLHREKLIDEMGDVFYYLCRMCDALGVRPEEVLKRNVAKLEKRMADGEIKERK